MPLITLTADSYVRMMKLLLPPGKLWNLEQDGVISKALKGASDELVRVSGRVADLMDELDPRTADELLPEFEAELDLVSTGTTDERRARIVGHLLQVLGPSPAKLKLIFADVFDLASTDVQILEHKNKFNDDFASTIGIRWRKEPSSGALSIVSGKLRAAVTGSTDARWQQQIMKAVRLSTTLEGGECDTTLYVSALDPPADDDFAGICFFDIPSGNAHLFGVRKVPGVGKRWTHMKIGHGVIKTTTTLDGSTPPTADFYMRMHHTFGNTAELNFKHGSTGFDGPWTSLGAAVAQSGMIWVGIFATSGALSATAYNFDVHESRIWCPASRFVYNWYAYRDPALAGTEDMTSANALITKIEPAQTDSRACQSTVFLANSANSLCGRDPLG